MKGLIVFIGIVAFLINSNIVAQCNEQSKTKVLLVGDSWAFFMGVDGTIDKVLKDWGHSGYKFFTDLELAQNGAKIHHFLAPGKQQAVSNALLSKPDVKFVHLSLSGNDLLGNWKSQSFTQFQRDSLMEATLLGLDSVVQFIKGVRSDIEIVLGSYAYPNFEEVISNFGDPFGVLGPSDHPFYSNWEKMEFPSNEEINVEFNIYLDLLADFYANDERVHFVPASGITQYTHGQTSPLQVAPFGTYDPFTVPLPYGNPAYPSPKNSMRDYQLTKDCFHLSAKGYRDLIGYTTQKYYHKAMMDDKYYIAENESTNGSVNSVGEVSGSLLVGVDDGTNYQTILTFETELNLEYTVDKASIFLHLMSQTGTHPINENVKISISDSHFGESTMVEVADFDAEGVETGNPCIFGSNQEGKWVRLDLPDELLEYIKPHYNTQFKIYTTQSENGLVEFAGVEDPEFAPVLNIVYGEDSYLAISEETIEETVLVYPNPTRDMITIEVNHAEFKSAEIYSMLGEKLLTSENTQLATYNLSTGTYFMRINTDKGVVVRKFIKE